VVTTACCRSDIRFKMRYFDKIRTSMRKMSPSTSLSQRERDRISDDSEFLRPPSSVLPASLFVLGGNDDSHKQSRLNTISSIINTMMGTTIVALPLGFAQSGISLGLAITIAMGAISCATCVEIVQAAGGIPDFADLVGVHAGRTIRGITWMMSNLVFLGAACVYHILMQESLFSVVSTVAIATGSNASDMGWWSRPFAAGIICLIFPVLIMKDLSLLVKFNAFGFIALWVTILFVWYHGILGLMKRDFQMDLSPSGPLVSDDGRLQVAYGGRLSFGPLGGMMMLSFFIHNAIQPITMNSPKETRVKDIIIAYTVSAILYISVGVLGCFGFSAVLSNNSQHSTVLKSNFLDMFGTTFNTSSEVLAFISRTALLLQLITVYPILVMVVRNSVFGALFRGMEPSRTHVIILAVSMLGLSYTCAALNVDVGLAVRMTGAIGGYVIVFLVPSIILVQRHRTSKSIQTWHWVFAGTVCLVGLLFFLLQFIPEVSP
jgi:solute carrier family 38 (sodium-coupled neutral amino acid transporter), member 9